MLAPALGGVAIFGLLLVGLGEFLFDENGSGLFLAALVGALFSAAPTLAWMLRSRILAIVSVIAPGLLAFGSIRMAALALVLQDHPMRWTDIAITPLLWLLAWMSWRAVRAAFFLRPIRRRKVVDLAAFD